MSGFLSGGAWGHGLATLASDGTVLDVWYPSPSLGNAPKSDLQWFPPRQLEQAEQTDSLREISTEVVRQEIELSLPVTSTADAYLRLHLLSHLLVKQNSINLEGLIPNLPLVIFTNRGPVLPEVYARKIVEFRQAGVTPHSLDKFPRLIDYVAPEKVRIADTNRVRLGAYLSPGTTIMHEGFVNFNAGTLGVSMVEGRVSQGVVIGDGSDIGGGRQGTRDKEIVGWAI